MGRSAGRSWRGWGYGDGLGDQRRAIEHCPAG
jgi:hypothetical protein